MFDEVEALQLGLRRDAEDAELLERKEDARAHAERPDRRRARAEELHAQELESAAVEEPHKLVAVTA